MRKPLYVLIALLAIALAAVAIWAFHRRAHEAQPSGTAPVAFSCADGKSMNATFAGPQVTLALSDGRTLVLPQTRSGSGIRYEQGNATFVSQGDTAFLDEGGTQTYTDCIVNATAGQQEGSATSTSLVFTDAGHTFQFSYPNQFQVTSAGPGLTQDWSYNASGMGLVLARVDVPPSYEPSTNLASSRFLVGTSPAPQDVADCLVAPMGSGVTQATTTINGTTYAKFTYGDAGAGNFYAITSYRTLRNSQCYAVEYVIHSTNLGNYDPSQGIHAFDEAKVRQLFEGMAQSFRFLQ